MKNQIPSSELALNSAGNIYHLGINGTHIADKIILVGDPKRVAMVASFFDTIDFTHENREIKTCTGTFNGVPITVISTGMGVGCIDIVVSELDTIANIDLRSREIKDEHRRHQLVRIGTCGILQPELPIGSVIASRYGLGLDGLMSHYSEGAKGIEAKNIENAFADQLHWKSPLAAPYCYSASAMLLEKIAFDMHQSITCTALGFFGPQGRQLRAAIQREQLTSELCNFQYKDLKIGNLEMECAPIFGLANLLQHDALTVCLGVANRVTHEFMSDYSKEMEQLIKTVLIRITK